MKALIEIECETKAELFAHLGVIRQQLKHELKPVKDFDVIQTPVTVEDDNCYGTHIARIITEE